MRSTHTGNQFPLGFIIPDDPDLVRRDLLFAKACGLNLVRLIAGMALPAQLDCRDEIALLVYEENLAAWVLGSGMLDYPLHFAEPNGKDPLPRGQKEPR